MQGMAWDANLVVAHRLSDASRRSCRMGHRSWDVFPLFHAERLLLPARPFEVRQSVARIGRRCCCSGCSAAAVAARAGGVVVAGAQHGLGLQAPREVG